MIYVKKILVLAQMEQLIDPSQRISLDSPLKPWTWRVCVNATNKNKSISKYTFENYIPMIYNYI